MNLCRYSNNQQEAFGFYLNDEMILPLRAVEDALQADPLPVTSLLDLLPGGKHRTALIELERRITEQHQQQLGRPSREVQLLTPVSMPGKFILLAGNYARHIQEGGGQVEEQSKTFPYLFMKPPTTFTHPGHPVRIPEFSPHEIDWEIELGVVIGQTCSKVSKADALKYVAGYTVVNDISDRAFHHESEKVPRPKDAFFDWQHGKWHDTFCPFGPCLLPGDQCPDPQKMHLILKVNDQIEQDGSTANMIFPVAAIIEFVSKFVTLHPGDVISTGTPDGVGKAKGRFLKHGDQLEARIDGIGTLKNPVI